MRKLLRRSEFVRGIVGSVRKIPSDIRRLQGRLGRRAKIRRYLTKHNIRKLQIGAGPNELSGWLNADYEPRRQSTIYLDATRSFPFPDDSFDFIFSEHMIEHVPFGEGLKMLRECHRVLKAGGKIRIATPNLNNISALANDAPSEEQKRYVAWARANHVLHSVDSANETSYRPSYVINNFFWGFGHYFVYDPETLKDALAAVGFRHLTVFNVGESDEDTLSGLEHHGGLISDEFNQFETMVVQGTKA